ncbi:hypothetical protein SKAU_G00124260 [Synaphobranchus kaupii]|uniref:Uncharacterized protein n=1 Tax=Synaphobranchus kaupii TaxID=118154 RepID=A0A9Q1FP52_SYNKA|nr:hypothetical protein SKAU_G00124260 [Synaphobranchus kaupii]
MARSAARGPRCTTTLSYRAEGGGADERSAAGGTALRLIDTLCLRSAGPTVHRCARRGGFFRAPHLSVCGFTLRGSESSDSSLPVRAFHSPRRTVALLPASFSEGSPATQRGRSGTKPPAPTDPAHGDRSASPHRRLCLRSSRCIMKTPSRCPQSRRGAELTLL